VNFGIFFIPKYLNVLLFLILLLVFLNIPKLLILRHLISHEEIKRVQQWYETRFSFRGLPLKEENIILKKSCLHRYGLFYHSPQWEKIFFCCLISYPFFFLVASYLFAWDGNNFNSDCGFIFLLIVAIIIEISCFLPALIIVLSEGKIIIYDSKEKNELTLAHELAHSYHNTNFIKYLFHAFIKVVLFPFFISYEEGIAIWIEKEYSKSMNILFDVKRYSLRYRLSYSIINSIQRIAGEKLITFAIKYL